MKAPTISWWHSSADGAGQRHEEPELGHRLWWNLQQNNTDRMERIDRDKSSGRKTKGENIDRKTHVFCVLHLPNLALVIRIFVFPCPSVCSLFDAFQNRSLPLRDEQEDEKAWCVVCELKEVVATATHSSQHSSLHSLLSEQNVRIEDSPHHPSFHVQKFVKQTTTLTHCQKSSKVKFYFYRGRKNAGKTHMTRGKILIWCPLGFTDLHPATTTSHNFVSSHHERVFKKKSRTRWPNQMNSKLPLTSKFCIHQCPQHGLRAWGLWSSFDNTPSGCDTLAASHNIVVILTTDWLQRRLFWTTPSTNLMECHNLGFQFHSHSSPDLVWTEMSSARTRTTSNLVWLSTRSSLALSPQHFQKHLGWPTRHTTSCVLDGQTLLLFKMPKRVEHRGLRCVVAWAILALWSLAACSGF